VILYLSHVARVLTRDRTNREVPLAVQETLSLVEERCASPVG
jgi:hypothetical protein